MPVIMVDGKEVHVRLAKRGSAPTDLDLRAIREAMAELGHRDAGAALGSGRRKHAGSCSNQNVLDPEGAYKGVEECGCDGFRPEGGAGEHR